MTGQVLIIFLGVCMLFVGIVWFARKQRKDLLSPRTKESRVGSERPSPPVSQENAEPSVVIREEQLPVLEQNPIIFQADVQEKTESFDVQDVGIGPQDAHETNQSDIGNEPPTKPVFEVSEEKARIVVAICRSAAPPQISSGMPELSSVSSAPFSVVPCGDSVGAFPVTIKRAEVEIPVEQTCLIEGVNAEEALKTFPLNNEQHRDAQSAEEYPPAKTGEEGQPPPSKPNSENTIGATDLEPGIPPAYSGLAPAPRIMRPQPTRRENRKTSSGAGAVLDVRLQLVFDRHGGVHTLALLPDRRDGMPDELDVTGTHGNLSLTEFRDDCYESISITDTGKSLREGAEWRGSGNARNWRWVLSRRELYVLAPGDESGLHGFISTTRLRLNARHVVLATLGLQDEVFEALTAAGCGKPEVNNDTTPGVPSGWLLFRDVIPAHAVPMREEMHILNALCPQPDVDPHFIGGIRLQGRTWLAGYPPRIRFTGALGEDFFVTIDGHRANLAADGAFEAPGWDTEGEHRLWFGGQSVTYTLRLMEETWDRWQAYDFGVGFAICGASVLHRQDDSRWRQVRVPTLNPLLIGAFPGEVYHCRPRLSQR